MSKQKPLRDMDSVELKQLRVILRILPDGTLWVTEEGKDSLERNVASWNPAHRPDMTEHSRVGGYILGDDVSDNAVDWIHKVSDKFDLNEDDIIAESWHGGGMRHKGKSPYDFVVDLRGTDKRVDILRKTKYKSTGKRSSASKRTDTGLSFTK